MLLVLFHSGQSRRELRDPCAREVCEDDSFVDLLFSCTPTDIVLNVSVYLYFSFKIGALLIFLPPSTQMYTDLASRYFNLFLCTLSNHVCKWHSEFKEIYYGSFEPSLEDIEKGE